MDPTVSASFIPKRPLVEGGGRRPNGVGLILLLSILIFVASMVSAGAVFAYTQFLKSSLVSKQESLQKVQEAYDPGVIEDLIRLDARMSQSKKILGGHVAPSALFAFLSTQTLEKVAFGSFEFKLDENGGAALEMNGEADSFSTVALQSDQFGASKVFKDVIFSNLAISAETGKVTFAVAVSVDPSLLLYSKSLTADYAPVQTTEIPVEIQSQGAVQAPAQAGTTTLPQGTTTPTL
ncbi:hypothetical protein H7X87_03530 [Acetobacteraceae bacterium]|nr:hypothetical protein [Candidatus Parcubacteria bacterium]